MDEDWAFFDASGERVRPSDPAAAFKGKPAVDGRSVDPGAPDSSEMAHWEFQDVHPIGRPDLKLSFPTLNALKAGLVELGLKAKGNAR